MKGEVCSGMKHSVEERQHYSGFAQWKSVCSKTPRLVFSAIFFFFFSQSKHDLGEVNSYNCNCFLKVLRYTDLQN